MAWGRKAGGSSGDELAAKLTAGTETLYVLPFRQFGGEDAEKFAGVLATNTTLKEFYASGKSIGVRGAAAFGAALAENTTLRALCVGGTTFGDEALGALTDGLARNTGLTKLDLENKSITAAGVEHVGSLLSVHPTLEWLSLSRNEITGAGVASLFRGLTTHPTSPLSHLELQGCELTGADLGPLATFLTADTCALRHLSLCHNAIGDVADVGVALGRATSLVSLDLTSCSLTEEFVVAMCSSAGTVTLALESLILDTNPDIGAAGAQALASAVAPTRTVAPPAGAGAGGADGSTSLDVTELEALAAEVVVATPRAISAFTPALSTLSFAGCSLVDSGATAIAHAVASSLPSLMRLDLAHNGIGARGAASLSAVLHLVASLRLFNNTVTDAGATLLLRMALKPVPVMSPTPLSALDLGANALTDDTASTVCGLLALPVPEDAQRPLATLELFANAFTDASDVVLEAALEGTAVGVDVVWRKLGGTGAPDPSESLPHQVNHRPTK